MRRRQFLILSAASIGGVLVYSLDGKASRIQSNSEQIKVPLRFFTQEEALAVAALTARIFPSSASGPGAREAGVVVFIDRQLAGPYGRDKYRYTQPPFEEGPQELGYQGKATPREIYRENLKPLLGIDQRSEAEQDKALHAIERMPFFNLLRTHTIEGMFCDPLHGGNADMIGWQLVGFPGPRMSHLNDIDRHYGEAYRPKPVSLREAGGKSYKPMEDEQ